MPVISALDISNYKLPHPCFHKINYPKCVYYGPLARVLFLKTSINRQEMIVLLISESKQMSSQHLASCDLASDYI